MKAMNLSHLCLVHSNDSGFCVQCGINGCSYTVKSFSAVYSHIYRIHLDSGVIQKRRRSQTEQESCFAVTVSSAQQQSEHQGDYVDAGKCPLLSSISC